MDWFLKNMTKSIKKSPLFFIADKNVLLLHINIIVPEGYVKYHSFHSKMNSFTIQYLLQRQVYI